MLQFSYMPEGEQITPPISPEGESPLRFRQEVTIKDKPYIFEGAIPTKPGDFMWHLRLPNWEDQKAKMQESMAKGELSRSMFDIAAQELGDRNAVAAVFCDEAESTDGKIDLVLSYVRTMTSMLPEEYGYKRAGGLGTFLLDNINALADNKGWRVYLDPTVKGAGLDGNQLVQWYDRHGYKRTTDSNIHILQRNPQTPDSTQVISQILQEKTAQSVSSFAEKPNELKGMQYVLDINKKQSQPSVFSVAGKDFDILPNVFSPALFYDGAFYAEVIPDMIKPGDHFLEIGPGAGLVSTLTALKGADVTAVDINPSAVENTRRNAVKHGVLDKMHIYEGDIFSPLPSDEKFDTIFWNVPFAYVNAEPSELSMLDRSIFDPQYGTLKKFLGEARAHLTEQGRVLIGFSSSLGHVNALHQFAREGGLKVTQLPLEALDPNVPAGNPEVKYELFEAKAV